MSIGNILCHTEGSQVTLQSHYDMVCIGDCESMEFQDKPITDILLALAEVSGKSIIPDETVQGRASYYFSRVDFDTALRVFLSTYNLYLSVEDGIYFVSRIRTSYNRFRNTVVLDAEAVEYVHILNALSKILGKTILYDALPSERVTLHAREISLERSGSLPAKDVSMRLPSVMERA